MTPVKTFSLLIVLLLTLIGSSAFYTITEGEQGLLLRLGKPVIDKLTNKPNIIKAGLHLKYPIIDNVVKLDMRLQTDAAKSSRIYIENENYFVVDYYVKWRINDLVGYYTSTGGLASYAEKLIEQKIDNRLRVEFGKGSLKDVVSQDRANIMSALKLQAVRGVEKLGISVVDVRLKTIELPESVEQSVFASMRAGRMIVANNYRAEGQQVATSIRAQADADRIQIIAQADRDAMQARAEGLALAAKIYSDAFNQEPEFFSFYRSINAYKEIFSSGKDVLVLKPQGDFFKFFNNVDNNSKS